MLNHAPIFLNCFSRGGSNILWNFFLTHPDVCSPILETLEIFHLSWKGVTRSGLVAAIKSRQLRLFDQWLLRPRRSLSSDAQRYIDRTLYTWKMKTVHDAEMKYRYQDEVYTPDQVMQTRLVSKNNNGLVFLSDVLCEMYPDAVFVGMVRDPVALYESHKRRGIAQSPAQFARFFNTIAYRMLKDRERFSRYHIIRFEDLLTNPLPMMHNLYAWADLDFAKVQKVRLKAKPYLQANGTHTTRYVSGRHYWFEPQEISDILEPKVNAYQRQQLADVEKKQVQAFTCDIGKQLGYT